MSSRTWLFGEEGALLTRRDCQLHWRTELPSGMRSGKGDHQLLAHAPSLTRGLTTLLLTLLFIGMMPSLGKAHTQVAQPLGPAVAAAARTVLAPEAAPQPPPGPAIAIQGEALPNFFSPNGDAVNDTALFKMVQSGRALVTARVESSQGVVRTIVPLRIQSAGTYWLRWNGLDDSGRRVPPGNYRWVMVAQTQGGATSSRGTIRIYNLGTSQWKVEAQKAVNALARFRKAGRITSQEHTRFLDALRYGGAVLEANQLRKRTREIADMAYVFSLPAQLDRMGELTPGRARVLIGKVLGVNARHYMTERAPYYNYSWIYDPASSLKYVYYSYRGIQFAPVPALNEAQKAWREGATNQVVAIADEILPMLEERAHNGTTFSALEYYFSYEGSQPLWTSAMAQAMAVEALGRAAALTGSSRYTKAAAKVLRSFEAPWTQGGSLDVDSHGGWWYPAFGYQNKDRGLNTMIITVMALDSHAKLRPSSPDGKQAKVLFTRGYDEVIRHLSEYDSPMVGYDQSDTSWSYYSKIHGLAQLHYHSLHVDQMKVLYEATGNSVFDAYYRKWGSGKTTMKALGAPGAPSHSANKTELTPNGDGVDDGAVITYTLPSSTAAAGYQVTIDIYRGSTLIKKVLSSARLGAGTHEAYWGGTDQRGMYVPDGHYRYVIYLWNPIGTTPVYANISVRNRPFVTQSQASPASFSPDGDGADDLTKLEFTLDRPGDAEVSVRSWRGPVRTVKLKGLRVGVTRLAWDGLDEKGVPIPNGNYAFRVEASNSAGSHIRTGPVRIAATKPSFRAVRWSPDPSSRGALFEVAPQQPGWFALRVYDYRGEVRTLVSKAMLTKGERYLWNGRTNRGVAAPPGTYRFEATLMTGGGTALYSGLVALR